MSTGILSAIGINAQETEDQTVVSGGGVWESQLVEAVVKEAYLFKTQGGLTKMQIKVAKADESETFESLLLLDADGKPYAAKTGSWKSTDKLVHLQRAVGIEDSNFKEGVVMMGPNEVKVQNLTDIVGKKLTVGVRKCEDDYKETVPYVNSFELFLPAGKLSEDDQSMADEYTAMIEKSPIKKKKGGRKPSGDAGTAGTTAKQDIKNLL